jgi:uncharacterized protein (DUF885 family)
MRVIADSFAARSRAPDPEHPWQGFAVTARAESRHRLEAIAASLHTIDRATLPSPAERLLYDNLNEVTTASLATAVCRGDLWNGVSQFAGWHVSAANWARVQAVGSERSRASALRNLRELPGVMATERDRLRRGVDSGYTASAAVIATVIRQLGDLLPGDVTRSPLHGPAGRDTLPAFRAQWRVLLADTVYPAAHDFRAFLAEEYLPRARVEGSLSLMQEGGACYAATLRSATSVQLNADSVARDARRELDSIRTMLAPLVTRITGDTDLTRGMRALRAGEAFRFSDRDSILAAYRAMTDRAASRVGTVIAGLSPAPLNVVPYPEFQEKADLPPQYLRAPPDGSRPAQFLVNLGRAERMAVANAVAHEAYPGHHAQRTAETRANVVHPAMQTLFVGAFTEGWGIYSEALGEEMGLYETDLDRAGYLVHLLDVAVAGYLDLAYHTRGWTRGQLVDSMMLLGGRTRPNAEAYADRHAATPAQLATYFIGYRAIKALREHAERTLGPKFNAAEFHREVLGDGTITLASLQSKIERWVEARR